MGRSAAAYPGCRRVRCAQAVRPGCGPACQRPVPAAVTVTPVLASRSGSLRSLVSGPLALLPVGSSRRGLPGPRQPCLARLSGAPAQSGLSHVGHGRASRKCPWRLAFRNGPQARQSRPPRVPRCRRRDVSRADRQFAVRTSHGGSPPLGRAKGQNPPPAVARDPSPAHIAR